MIMVLEVLMGRMLDEGKTYEEVVWPMLAGFAVLGLATTLPLMKLLAEKVRWNAAVAAAGGRRGGGGAVGGH
jgi:hypothetical protein